MQSKNCIQILVEESLPVISVRGTPGSYTFKGSAINLLDAFAQKYGLCYTLSPPKERLKFGTQMDNGSYTGALGEIQQGLYELLVCQMYQTPKRCESFDCSTYLGVTKHSALYRAPKISPDLSGFVKPLTYEGWLLIFIVTFVMAIVLYGYQRRNSYLARLDLMDPIITTNALLHTLQVLLAQGLAERQLKLSSRMVFCLWMMSSLFLGFIYKCNLRALLITPKIQQPFNNVQELVKQNKFSWVIFEGTMLETQAKLSDPGTAMRTLYEGKTEFTLVNHYRTMEDILKEDITFVFATNAMQATLSEYILATKETGCNYSSMKETFFSSTYGFMYRKGSILKEKLDPVIVAFQESGITRYHEQPYNFYNIRCSSDLTQKIGILRPLSLRDFYGVFTLHGIGLILGLCAFMIETLRRPQTK